MIGLVFSVLIAFLVAAELARVQASLDKSSIDRPDRPTAFVTVRA